MSLDYEAIGQAVRAWVLVTETLADDQVIFANQSAPRPVPPFVTVNVLTGSARVGIEDEERLTDTPGEIVHVGQRRVTVTLNTFGPGAKERLETILGSTRLYRVREILDAAGLSVVDPGKANDLTDMLETAYEERAHADVIFATADVETEQVGWIETITITGTISEGATVVTETFTEQLGG